MSEFPTEAIEHVVHTFSQEGEDVLLRRILRDHRPGFYVDVGAYHPYRFSNTYVLHRHGWRGINIDANPGTKPLFDRARPLDVNIDAIISDQDGLTVKFDIYKEAAFNSAIAERRPAYIDIYLETVERPATTLKTLLNEHLPRDVSVDVLSVDVEGLELKVLKSNDWQAVRPSYVLVETEVHLLHPEESEVVRYMSENGYNLRSYMYLTALFTLREKGFW